MKRIPPRRAAPRGNPMALLAIVDRTQPHTQGEVDRIMTPVDVSLVRMLDGTADDQDVTRLGTCINLASFRIHLKDAEVKNAEPLVEVLLAGNALEHAMGIKARHGRYGLTGPGRQHLQDGVDVYRALVTDSSPYQMHRAETDLFRHLKRAERQAA